jgi:hypothetical protein
MASKFVNPSMITLPDGTQVPVRDVYGDRPLYSSALIGTAATGDKYLFKYSLGDTVAGSNANTKATEEHTNTIYNQGRMSDSDEMKVFSMAVEFDAGIATATAIYFMDGIYLELWTGGGKAALDGLLRHFPGGTGLHGATTLNQTEFVNNGIPDSNARYAFAIPISIEPNKDFWIKVKIPSAMNHGLADQLVRAVLRGPRVLAA